MTFGNSAFYLYIETVLNMVLGYAFWMTVSITLGASFTGESSAAITWSVILSTFSTVGIAVGVQRFLGKTHVDGDKEAYSAISQFLVIFTIVTLIVGSFVYLLTNNIFTIAFWSSSGMLSLVIFSSLTYGMTTSLRSILISSGHTRFLVFVLLLSVVVRFSVLITSLILKLGPTGVVVSYLSFYICSTFILLYRVRWIIDLAQLKIRSLTYKKEIIKASISGWIPNAASILGSQSGVLFVFGLNGSDKAGIYFIAFSIFTALSSLPMSVISMAYPVMSGMKEGREVFLWRATKMALFSLLPVLVVIAVYPLSIMSLFGKEFESGKIILPILIASLIPVEVNRAVSNLAYAQGKYKQVLLLGVIPNIVRFSAYAFLVPMFGGIGTAFSFLLGSIVGLFQSVIICKRSNYKFPGMELSLIISVPVILGLLTSILIPNAAIGTVIIMIGSYAAIARFRFVSYAEIEGTIKSVFPNSEKANNIVLSVAKYLFH